MLTNLDWWFLVQVPLPCWLRRKTVSSSLRVQKQLWLIDGSHWQTLFFLSCTFRFYHWGVPLFGFHCWTTETNILLPFVVHSHTSYHRPRTFYPEGLDYVSWDREKSGLKPPWVCSPCNEKYASKHWICNKPLNYIDGFGLTGHWLPTPWWPYFW